MQVVVMAAGMGSRFGGLKQMEAMDEYGNFLLDYSIYDAKRAGFDEVIFIIKHEFEEIFKNSIGKRLERIISVKYAFQELDDIPLGYNLVKGRTKPWGTLHAILSAKDLITGPFIIINGDDYYGKESYEIAYDFVNKIKNTKGIYANVTYEVAKTITANGSVKRGVCFTDDKDNIVNLIECSIIKDNNTIIANPLDTSLDSFMISNDTKVSMNFFCFSKDVLERFETAFNDFLKDNINELKSECLVPIEIGKMVQKGEITLKLLSTPSIWQGITYKEDKEQVVKYLKNLRDSGLYKKSLYE